jgi:hypothetical protein
MNPAFLPGQGPASLPGPSVSPAAGQPSSGQAEVPNVLVNNPSEDGTNARDTQSETTLVVGANNTIVAAYNDSLYAGSSPHQSTGYSLSIDGGATFVDQGRLPAGLGGDGGDPVLAYDNVTGRIYLATLSYSSENVVNIFRSDDNGATYSAAVNGAPSSGASWDKEWLTVDNFPGPGQGNVYLVARDFGSGDGIYLTRSTDGGATWGPTGGTLIAAAGSGNVQGAWVTVGPDHAVYVFWFDNSTSTQRIKMRKSVDQGVTFAAPVQVATLHTTASNGDLGLTGIRAGTSTASAFRSNAFPQAVVNPVNGDLYVTYNDRGTAPGDKADVFFAQSNDGGTTWSTPVKVNDDTTNHDQWSPALAVTPNGSKVGIFWYDRRDDPGNNLIDRYGAIGTVAGDTVIFDPNFRITDVSCPPEFGRDPEIVSTYMGDYDMAVATTSAFYLTWGDNRSPSHGHTGNNADVRFAAIPVVVAGPSVIVQTPTGTTFGSVSSVRLRFDEEIDPDSFTLNQVAGFTRTAGGVVTDLHDALIAVTPAADSANRQFDITFATQAALGAYTLVIGPNILDTSGNPMDQNHNGTPGEDGIAPDGDQYAATFTIAGPKVIASTPSGSFPTSQIDHVRLTFNEPIDQDTFTVAQVASFTRTVGATVTDLSRPLRG